MRYEKGHKEATRQRIIDFASAQFKADGLASVSLSSIMTDAGLTNGGFYAHFQSKDDLIGASIDHSLEVLQIDFLRMVEEGGFESALRQYLSIGHRDNPGRGCPSAALLGEIARLPKDVRNSYTERFNSFIDMLVRFLPNSDGEAMKRTARAIFGLAVGSLQLARAVADPELSESILEGAVRAAMEMVRGADGSR